MGRTRRILRWLTKAALLTAVVLGLAACTKPSAPEFTAHVEPAAGHVPYDARVVCTPLVGTYTVELPNGRTLSGTESEFEVTVDALDWVADVTWSDGSAVRTATAEAHGTNAAPRILRPRINGVSDRWYLQPRERTLIDFTHYPSTLAGPETGVAYEASWRVVEIAVECERKTLCGEVIGDSIFYPPYEAGALHASFGGVVYQNACIVYPLYTGERAPDGKPYVPRAEAGYIYDPYRTHNLFDGVAYPEQEATIRVTVQDNFGRRTVASFVIPVQDGGYRPGEGSGPHDPLFYVGNVVTKIVHTVSCPEVCLMRREQMRFFCHADTAVSEGYVLGETCLGGPPQN